MHKELRVTIDQEAEPAMDRQPSPAAGGPRAAEPFDPFAPAGGVDRAVEARPSIGPAMPGPGGLALPPRRRNRASSGLVLVGAMLLAVAGVAFAVGRTSAPVSMASGAGGLGNVAAGPRASGDPAQAGAGGSISVSGTVVELTSDHLTLKLVSRQTVQIALDSSTANHAQAAASGTGIAQGASVTVRVAGGGPIALDNPGAASGAPAASGSAARTFTAQDVTITGT